MKMVYITSAKHESEADGSILDVQERRKKCFDSLRKKAEVIFKNQIKKIDISNKEAIRNNADDIFKSEFLKPILRVQGILNMLVDKKFVILERDADLYTRLNKPGIDSKEISFILRDISKDKEECSELLDDIEKSIKNL